MSLLPITRLALYHSGAHEEQRRERGGEREEVIAVGIVYKLGVEADYSRFLVFILLHLSAHCAC